MPCDRRQLFRKLALAGSASCVAVTAVRRSTAALPAAAPRAGILLQIYFQVAPARTAEFEKMFAESYVPALRKQVGYRRANLLRLYPRRAAKEIEATPTEYNYQMELVFDSEPNRQKWVASKEHAVAWPLAMGLAEKFTWRGYDLVTRDQRTP